ncbi:phenylalanyl-tRNA synthetase beta chain [Salinibacillus kushneri]|uniref:Phenylalanine--tRNA ligase beta subunit n=1 Tax=Salinibacillus kushneri TaxID=237682 RepID=A0A1I0H3W0_9BACI|nr:phenylalanine--tRNA ligase subunit beta [Salinibacillus kushneri]SET78291.1 phenylalanyl-tRNA synthetase beta chain [Salinibacillus kushneri]
MLLSLNWLKQYVDLDDISPDDLAEKITKGGIEVDGVETFGEGLKNIVVGYVKSCEQHSNADKLNVCQVDVGDEELQIICGAPNVATGQKVVVAKPGARLPGGMKIKKTKLRGEVSNGMICSLQELGIDQKFIQKEFEDGIFVFPEDTEVGSNAVDLLNLNDTILDLDITPNRADSFSMMGMAYEVAAILDKDLHLPEVEVNRIDEKAEDYVKVRVEDADLNPYYGAYIVKNIKIGPSPLWMQNRLIAAGIRPINNVVDITNYVLMEYGQPLHAFDFNRFGSNEVVVRRARNGETMTTLDGEERNLQKDHLLITNGKEGMALAGVMGGVDSEVKDDTSTILVEAAYFNPLTVRKAAKDHGLRSESSIRFERGVDPNRVKEAGLRACQLMQKYAGGEVLEGIAEFDEQAVEQSIVEFDAKTINRRLGTAISVEEMKNILHRLRFSFEEADAHFTVYAPSRRGDIQIVEDMLEEIARIYGYDQLPYTLPEGTSNAGGLTTKQKLKRSIHRYMQSAGLNEAMTYSLTKEENTAKFMDQYIRALQPKAVKLAMPMSEAHSHLRLSILPELLSSVQYNLARRQQNVALYELGSIYVNKEENISKQPDEQLRLSAAITGIWVNQQWQKEVKTVDFYVLKGVVEGLLDLLDIQHASFESLKMEQMHPGRTAAILVQDEHVGFIGQIHPAVQKDMDLTDTYVFDLDVDRLLEVAMENEGSYEPIPRYPSVSQDLAFVVDEEIPAKRIMDVISDAGKPYLKDIQVFDIYQGEHMDAGKKSIAFSVRFQDPEATLKDEQVEEARKQIVNTVEDSFHAVLRG